MYFMVITKINLKTSKCGVVADATAGGTLVLFIRNSEVISLKVNSANAASATSFANGSVNSVVAG